MINLTKQHASRLGRSRCMGMLVWPLLVTMSMAFYPVDAGAQLVFDINDRTGVIVCDDGRVHQWGLLARQVELGAEIVPVRVVKSLGTYGIDATGNVYAWEVQCKYHVAEVDSFVCIEPRRLELPAPMRQVAASEDCILYLDINGGLWGAGRNGRNKFMEADTPDVVFPPRRIDMPGAVREVRVGSGNIVSVLEDGTVWTWGYNRYGFAGTGDTAQFTQISRVATLSSIRNVRSDFHVSRVSPVFAIDSSGRLFGWGPNSTGQLGDGTHENRWVPVQIPIENVIDVRNGNDHTVALTADGSVWTWGSNTYGGLGLGHDSSMLTPRRVPSLRNIRAIGVGGTASVAIDADGVWWGWGDNYSGLLPGLSYEIHRSPARCTPPCLASGVADTPSERNTSTTLWPQPASSILHVQFGSDETSLPIEAELVDLLGTVVASATVTHTVPTFDVSGLADGVYFLRWRGPSAWSARAAVWVMR